jgi:hypothetical protein
LFIGCYYGPGYSENSERRNPAHFCILERMAKIIETNIEHLIPDSMNFNKGTEYGQHLIEESLRRFGAGRSILLDKNNRIIAGNKTIENAAIVGLDNVVIVETDGNQIVAVKRKDIDLDSVKGRELALADNATSKVNIAWDEAEIEKAVNEFGIEPEAWGVDVSSLPDEVDGVDLTADELKKIQGDDKTLTERIIIVYPPEKKSDLERLLGIQINKVVFDISELTDGKG